MPTNHAKRWFSKGSFVLLAAVVLALGAARSDSVAQGKAQHPQPPQGFPDLVSGLKAVPGCLGVETAATSSGKQVIFAWFEDKAAVLRWYYSDMHQGVIKMAFPNYERRGPLQGVPDDVGPLLAIASITFSDKPQFETSTLPISQIAIELYKPVPGGLSLGGRFAPANLKVPGMRDYTPKESK